MDCFYSIRSLKAGCTGVSSKLVADKLMQVIIGCLNFFKTLCCSAVIHGLLLPFFLQLKTLIGIQSISDVI